ncbi:unnamed protein product [Citrullus colocynthis]|uniref:Uncharacterized protein n=1 Tax=Citrullus colocynthis TaxID=252529 RepID=A0ABP0YW80_9ROSI
MCELSKDHREITSAPLAAAFTLRSLWIFNHVFRYSGITNDLIDEKLAHISGDPPLSKPLIINQGGNDMLIFCLIPPLVDDMFIIILQVVLNICTTFDAGRHNTIPC